MQPRDIFDGILIAVLVVLLYLQIVGPTLSMERVRTVVDALLAIDLTVYLVFGGILAIGFLGYMFIYLPQKQSQSPQ